MDISTLGAGSSQYDRLMAVDLDLCLCFNSINVFESKSEILGRFFAFIFVEVRVCEKLFAMYKRSDVF